MLYLAEVKNQNKGFVRGYKTELKLLASQQGNQSWNTIVGNDTITLDIINEPASKGTLYILNLNNNKQPQSTPELAGARVVNYLRQLSRILEKSKQQELEIEEWKDSLRLQGEQIGLRQNELDQQQQLLSQQQQDLARLEKEKEQLNNAWEQVRKEQARANENKGKLHQLLQQFQPGNVKPENMGDLLTAINHQQRFLDNYWQQLKSERNNLPKWDEELKTKESDLEKHRQELEDKQNKLQQALVSAQSNGDLLQEKEQMLKPVDFQLEAIDRLEQEVSLLGDDNDDSQIDVHALENMPLGDLEETVNKLQQETSKLVDFVNLQEEELSLQAEQVQEIESRIAQATEVEKFTLEGELEDAKEAMKLLNETLVGQRKNLKKQQKTLNDHGKILSRRKGVAEIDLSETINIKPLMAEINRQRNYLVEQKANLDSEIAQLSLSQNQLEQEIYLARQEYEAQKTKSQEKEKRLLQIYQQVTESECNVSLLEQILEPLQEQVQSLSSNLRNYQPDNTSLTDLINELQSML